MGMISLCWYLNRSTWWQQPTAQFYGKVEQRHVTITEGEKASLPLRLTGDGVRSLSSLFYYFLSYVL